MKLVDGDAEARRTTRKRARQLIEISIINAKIRVRRPQEHVRDGQIILNISPSAVSALHLGNESLNFEGRFGGIPKIVSVPIGAVCGIYAKENGQGMIFDPDSAPPEPPEPEPTTPEKTITVGPSDKKGNLKPSLRIVK